MSTEAVVKFAEYVAGNEELQAQADSIRQRSETYADGLSQLASEHGYEFSPAEFASVSDALTKLNKGELSEAELESVVGSGLSFASINKLPQVSFGWWFMQGKDIQNPPLSGGPGA